MSDISRFGFSVDDELLQSYDRLIARQSYANRSEALRDALVKSRIEDSPETGTFWEL